MNNAERAGALVIARLTKALEDLVKLDEWDEKVRGGESLRRKPTMDAARAALAKAKGEE